MCGGFNGHIEKQYLDYEDTHGGYGFGTEMFMVKEYWSLLLQVTLLWAVQILLGKIIILSNTNGNSSSQIDYNLFQHDKYHLVEDTKVIPGEECVIQQHLLACELNSKY